MIPLSPLNVRSLDDVFFSARGIIPILSPSTLSSPPATSDDECCDRRAPVSVVDVVLHGDELGSMSV